MIFVECNCCHGIQQAVQTLSMNNSKMEKIAAFCADAPCLPLPLEELVGNQGEDSVAGQSQCMGSPTSGMKQRIRKLSKAIEKLCKSDELVEAIILSKKLVDIALGETRDSAFQREAAYNHIKLIGVLSNGKRKASEDISLCVEFLHEAIQLLKEPQLQAQSHDFSGNNVASVVFTDNKRERRAKFTTRWSSCRMNLHIMLLTNIALCHYQLVNIAQAKEHINEAIAEVQRGLSLGVKVEPEVESFARLAMCSFHSKEDMHDLALKEALKAITTIESVLGRGMNANLIESLVYAYYNAGVESEHLSAHEEVHPSASAWYSKALKLSRRHYRLFSREMIRSFEDATSSAKRAEVVHSRRPASAPQPYREASSNTCAHTQSNHREISDQTTQEIPRWLRCFSSGLALGLSADPDLNDLRWMEFMSELQDPTRAEEPLKVQDLRTLLHRLFQTWLNQIPDMRQRINELVSGFPPDLGIRKELFQRSLATFPRLHVSSYYDTEMHFKDILFTSAEQDPMLQQWEDPSGISPPVISAGPIERKIMALCKMRLDLSSVSPSSVRLDKETVKKDQSSSLQQKEEAHRLLLDMRQGPVPLARPIWPSNRDAVSRNPATEKFSEEWPPLVRHEEMMRMLKVVQRKAVKHDWTPIADALMKIADAADAAPTSRQVKAVFSSPHLDFSSQLQTLILSTSNELRQEDRGSKPPAPWTP